MSDPLRRLGRMIHGLAARCVLRLAVDGAKMQTAQVGLLADETADGVERFQNYGMTSVPLPGAEGVCLFLGGDRGHGVIIAMDDRRYRLAGLQGGEVALYTDEGDTLVFRRGRLVELTTDVFRVRASTKVEYITPSFSMTSPAGGGVSATIQGGLRATGDVVGEGVSLAHHTHPGDSGGTTGQPNGGA